MSRRDGLPLLLVPLFYAAAPAALLPSLDLEFRVAAHPRRPEPIARPQGGQVFLPAAVRVET